MLEALRNYAQMFTAEHNGNMLAHKFALLATQ
jgi:hypothetical protein